MERYNVELDSSGLGLQLGLGLRLEGLVVEVGLTLNKNNTHNVQGIYLANITGYFPRLDRGSIKCQCAGLDQSSLGSKGKILKAKSRLMQV